MKRETGEFKLGTETQELDLILDALQASLVAQMVKNLPAMQETWVRSLGQDDPLEMGTAIHSSILTWKIPWTEEIGRLQSMGSQQLRNEHFQHTPKH